MGAADGRLSGLTFFFDESMHKGVYLALRQVRSDVLFPGEPECDIAPGDRDEEWLPKVGDRGWILIMRDKKIRTRPGQRQLVLEHGIRAFCLTSSGQKSKWDTLNLLVRQWNRIEGVLLSDSGPFIYTVTEAGLRKAYVKEDH